MTPDEFRRLHGMRVDGADPLPDPWQSYADAAASRALPPALVAAFRGAGFSAPTYIQAQAWPIASTGRDLVAIAATGSGKTLGFLAPAFAAAQQAAAAEGGAGAAAAGDEPPHYRAARAVQARAQATPRSGHLHRHPSALVLAPTRELAQQTQAEAERFGRALGLRSVCLYGGAGRGQQARELRQRPGPAIIVATPGRLLDFVRSGDVDLSRVRCLVLDEADRMLDMGFEPQIREIARELPASGGGGAGIGGGGEDAAASGAAGGLVEASGPASSSSSSAALGRQTLFFSATWPREVQGVARALCRNAPVRVMVGDAAARPVANRAVEQRALLLARRRAAPEALADYLRAVPEGGRAIVFCETQHECERVAERLADDVPELAERSRRRAAAEAAAAAGSGGGPGSSSAPAGRRSDRFGDRSGRFDRRDRRFRESSPAFVAEGAAAVHGGKSQRERDAALAAFRSGRLPVLVATDVAARGLDIQGVTHVVNLCFPREAESYVHRIGRTGRAGATGEALTLIARDDADAAGAAARLAAVMREAGKDVPDEVAELAERAARRRGGGFGGGGFGGRGGGGRGYGRGGGGGGGGYGGSRGRRDGGYGGGGYGGRRAAAFDGEGGDGEGGSFGRAPRRSSRSFAPRDHGGGGGGGGGDDAF
jgi:ATP-dependent RNA helicase DDX5/DBP2